MYQIIIVFPDNWIWKLEVNLHLKGNTRGSHTPFPKTGSEQRSRDGRSAGTNRVREMAAADG